MTGVRLGSCPSRERTRQGGIDRSNFVVHQLQLQRDTHRERWRSRKRARGACGKACGHSVAVEGGCITPPLIGVQVTVVIKSRACCGDVVGAPPSQSVAPPSRGVAGVEGGSPRVTPPSRSVAPPSRAGRRLSRRRRGQSRSVEPPSQAGRRPSRRRRGVSRVSRTIFFLSKPRHALGHPSQGG